MNRHPLDGDAIAADRHYDRLHETGHGEEEGSICNRDGCDGLMDWPEVEGCSCHINPPCGRCENNPLTCDTCGSVA